VARAQGVPLPGSFLVPVGFVDPDYDEFWKPWAACLQLELHFATSVSRGLAAAARQKTKIRFVDLREDLMGIPGTYRKLDGHWSQKG